MAADPDKAERLRLARAKAGYESAAEAARALGMKSAAYSHHENGTRGFLDHAPLYASLFNHSLEWLLTGRGSPTGGVTIPLRGQIGAGERVAPEHSAAEVSRGATVEMPRARDCEAFVVRGDSMQPRFFRGEVLLFEARPTPPERLIAQICRVELADGSNYVKLLRRSGLRWSLYSIRYNEPVIDDVEIARAYRWVALMPPRNIDAFLLAAPIVESIG